MGAFTGLEAESRNVPGGALKQWTGRLLGTRMTRNSSSHPTGSALTADGGRSHLQLWETLSMCGQACSAMHWVGPADGSLLGITYPQRLFRCQDQCVDTC